MIAEVLDRVIAFAARDEAELVRGREEWAEQAGRVFDDDSLYEERATAFLEWFALERKGPEGRLPGERFLAEERLDDLEGRWVDALLNSHRSLFGLKKLQPGLLTLDDLLGGGAFQVTERRKLPGVVEGDVFEARVVPNVVSPPELLFTRAFQFHPREAVAEVRRLAERAKKAGSPRPEVLFKLARLRLKALRYGHVAAAEIYAGDDTAPLTPVVLVVIAAASTGIPADRFVPGVGPVTLIGAEGASVTALGQGSLSLSLGVLRDPIRLDLSSGQSLSRPVRWQLSSDFAAEAGLFRRRLGLSIGLPIVWWQAGDRLRGTGDEQPLARTAAGDMRFRLKVAVRNTGRVHLAALLQLTVPLGGEHDFAATDGVTVEPRLILDAHLGRVFLAFALGVRFSAERELFLTRFGDEITWSAGGGVAVWQKNSRYLALILETVGAAGDSPGTRPVELRGAARLGVGPFTVDVGAGGGLDGEVAAPPGDCFSWRALWWGGRADVT